MEDLFTITKTNTNTPLAALIRPKTIDEFIGQTHVLAKGKPLRTSIEQDKISSLIFYGAPGCGKTTLAHIIAKHSKATFVCLNAVSATVKDVRDTAAKAKEDLLFYQKKTIVFIDEIHRFSKSQQDALLPFVEDGTITFIGATTENPFFAINAPLLSRSNLYEFKPLTSKEMLSVLDRAIKKCQELFSIDIIFENDKVQNFFIEKSSRDARRLLNVLEFSVNTLERNGSTLLITQSWVVDIFQKQMLLYDKTGDNHFDTISAFIKSMRGSDPDSALYWLAKMISSGEDIDFIGRRICICASEDVGIADSNAILVAKAAWDVAKSVGYPEARIPLAHAVCYIATAPKSNACYKAINKALSDIERGEIKDVPSFLKNKTKQGEKTYTYPFQDNGEYSAQKYFWKTEKYFNP